MAKEKYLVSSLADDVRQYLTSVRQSGGVNMAGIFMAPSFPIATWGFSLTGIALIGVVLFIVIPPLNHPTHQAMLLTAGLLMGGWLLLGSIRVMLARVRQDNLGEFTYADPKQIWVVNNTLVERYPLDGLLSIKPADKTLHLQYRNGEEQVSVPFEVGILEIAAYVEYWLSVRGSGPLDQDLITAHAAVARAVAYDQTPDEQNIQSLDIPVPHRAETPRPRPSDWPILLGIAIGGVALFFVVHEIILAWHDDAVFDFVRHQTPTHWRAYLVDERNTRHREEIKTMLHGRYQQKAEQLKQRILAAKGDFFPDTDEAMVQLLLALADAPQAIVTLRVDDATDEKVRAQLPALPNSGQLVTKALTEITDSLYSAIGQDLISLAQPPDDVPALVNLRFKFIQGDNNRHRLEWTLAVRKDPDGEPIYQATCTTDFPDQPGQAENAFGRDLSKIKNALAGGGP